MTVHSTVSAVTEKIVARSKQGRALYLSRLEEAVARRPQRKALGCANVAHGFAACGTHDKNALRNGDAPNLAIVTSYNDMLSAHQPFETYPALIRAAAREAGATAQVAGGVPAMCDGVTQGETGMELSLFSRDVIALSTAVALSRQMMWRMMGADDPMEAHKVDSRGIYARGRSDDVKEGVVSFLEKRPAQFKDKVSSDMPDYFPWWQERDYK